MMMFARLRAGQANKLAGPNLLTLGRLSVVYFPRAAQLAGQLYLAGYAAVCGGNAKLAADMSEARCESVFKMTTSLVALATKVAMVRPWWSGKEARFGPLKKHRSAFVAY
eukprot:1255127-Pleurochrysis_carterae.AAC.1